MTLSGAAVNASAIVLAGGKSLRMGSPKCLLPFDGEPLIAHLARRLRSLFAEVIVGAAPDQELPLAGGLSKRFAPLAQRLIAFPQPLSRMADSSLARLRLTYQRLILNLQP